MIKNTDMEILHRKDHSMFCPTCNCEYTGWIGKCPNCETLLVLEKQAINRTQGTEISYNALIDLVKGNEGKLIIEISTTEVGIEKKGSFPYFGYGFAWAARMHGSCNDIVVDLTAGEIGKKKKATFPYLGLGYAWAKTMQGSIGGNDVQLHVKKVNMEKKWVIYWGFGFAWTQEMSGTCGDRLRVDFVTTDVGRKKEWGFPYKGYGFTWAKKGELTITLI